MQESLRIRWMCAMFQDRSSRHDASVESFEALRATPRPRGGGVEAKKSHTENSNLCLTNARALEMP